jgi:uncharacterized protein (DUF362 family)/Pyruvate/2-oxoacid:ferredoxin oxidoreductase delta subunit
VAEFLASSGVDFSGKKVLVKPNILMGKPPEKAVTTHPAVVSAVVDFLLEHGAKVTVGDNPGVSGYGASIAAARKSGIFDASRGCFANISAEFRHVPVKSGGLGTLNVSAAVLDADLIVNVPKLKTHGLTTYTGAVKNMFGILVGGDKARAHASAPTPLKFAEALVDILSVRPPELNVMDAVLAMDGDGPGAGHAREVGLLGFSTDPVALDAVFLRLAGIDPEKIHHVRIAAERGFGKIANRDIEVIGRADPIKNFKIPGSRKLEFLEGPSVRLVNRVFFPNISGHARLSLIRKLCTKCLICTKGCPSSAMGEDKNGYPEIRKDKCIACYCCHELCPESAWKMSGMMRLMRMRTGR